VTGTHFKAHTPQGDINLRLALPGEHNVANALAAIAVGLACGVSLEEICEGLELVRPVSGRLSSSVAPGGATVVDDCYNANPGSVRAAIDLLSTCPGHRTLVLGAMRELGPGSEELHSEVGNYARECGIESLWGVGDELLPTVRAFGDGGQWFVSRDAASVAASGAFGADDTVLVKGSRSAGMEQVLQALLESASGGSD
jgi:UDP-N-acetylmuramoyl-tripeptide--D-alanyl-D-alanine ligase